MPQWYPVCDHPDAGGRAPWFSVDDRGLVHRADGHPMGLSFVPVFRVIDDAAYATPGDHTLEAASPWFQIVGTMVSRASGHPLGPSTAPWYQSRG